MSLTDRLAEADRRPAKLPGCTVCRWINTLPAKDRDELNTWVNSGLAITPLWEACAAEGLTVGLSSFRTHLRLCRGAQ